MESLIISLNAVLPIFILLVIGYMLKSLKMVNNDFITKANKLVFKLFLPTMLFKNVYTSDLKSAFNIKLFLFIPCAILVLYLLTCLYITAIRKDPKRRGAMIQATFRSNYVILGLPVVLSIYENEPTAIPALVAAIAVPCFNLLAVITLEVFRGGKPNPLKITRSIVTNPLIIASVLGLICNLISVDFPAVIDTTVSQIAGVTTPLSIIMLGAFFRFDNLKTNIKDVMITVVGRLAVTPLIGSVAAYLMGFRGVEFATLLIVFSAPTAVAGFTMAQQMDSDYELAGESIIVSSALSCFTIFLWVFLYSSLGII